MFALLLLIAGVAPAAPALTAKQFDELGERLMDIEWMRTPGGLDKFEKGWKAQLAAKDPAAQGRAAFLLGYLAEFRETTAPENPKKRDYIAAQDYYQRAIKTGSGYALQAQYRLGVLGTLGLLGARAESKKIAVSSFKAIVSRKDQRLWVRQRLPANTPTAAVAGVELAGAGTPEGGHRALLITSAAAKIKQGPVLQPFSMAATARTRLESLAGSGQNPKK
ncbi:MAG: hypothetical protein ACYDCO_10880 [Armatimonadota bacterium]